MSARVPVPENVYDRELGGKVKGLVHLCQAEICRVDEAALDNLPL